MDDLSVLFGFVLCLSLSVIDAIIDFIWNRSSAWYYHNLLCKEVLNENKRNDIR